ncbi:nucleotide-sugar transporter (macronuclear) [Tetrahymena thermophila SB210]|uniref:Nucleotide-sugar transporter n=1 Tax=Tetrahymena thermophila (strain SB210) TaxID=312017 RepID=Q22T84_TETTS|nr:nucleotide-sugar transporter [Tetrahymena thermophila SB210]EAR88554.2 nucleotide-sugar transporter [Tetrahymena thermophila SB210]|eukprot:XP_001008799.2 nucleotide-sugar transporter [Tetrahymena thermophila SB210]
MTTFKVNLLLVILLFEGVGTGIIFKQQQRSIVNGVQFNHPFMQTMLMFIGEALCYLIYLLQKKYYPKDYELELKVAKERGLNLNPSKWIFAIPTACDFTASTISFFAMSMMPLSIYYMIRGGNIVITAVFSVIFLKRKLFRQHVLGLFLAVCGFATIGITSILLNKSDDIDPSKLLLGIILIICSFFFSSGQSVLEEKLFKMIYLNPNQLVGYEGTTGIFITWVALNIFSYIPCPQSMADDCPNGMMEDVPQFFKTVFTIEGPFQPTLLIMIFLGIIAIAILNGLAFYCVKYASALSRSMISQVSPFVVWMFTIAIGWDKFRVGQFCGYIVVVFGCLIYYEIIVIPFWGFNRNLKANFHNLAHHVTGVEDVKPANQEVAQVTPALDKQDSEQPLNTIAPIISNNAASASSVAAAS